jgi:hypothetical protein
VARRQNQTPIPAVILDPHAKPAAETLPLSRNWGSSFLTRLMGTAKPMPLPWATDGRCLCPPHCQLCQKAGRPNSLV